MTLPWHTARFDQNAAHVVSGGGGGGYDAATTAWVNQVVSNGGTVSTTQKGYVDTLVLAIKASASLGPNLNSVLDQVYLLANADNSSIQARTNLINPAAAIASTGSPSWTNGYTPDGTGVLDTAFVPSSPPGGSNYAVGSASFGFYIFNTRISGFTLIDMGSYDGTNIDQILPQSASNGSIGYVNSTGSAFGSPTAANSSGLSIMTRVGTTPTYYKYQSGGNTSDTNGVSSGGLPSRSLYIGGRNNQGTADSQVVDLMMMAFIGGGMSSTAAGSWSTCINAYMTSLGLNVY